MNLDHLITGNWGEDHPDNGPRPGRTYFCPDCRQVVAGPRMTEDDGCVCTCPICGEYKINGCDCNQDEE